MEVRLTPSVLSRTEYPTTLTPSSARIHLEGGIDFIHLRSEDLVREQATLSNDFGLKEEYDKLRIDDHLLVGSIPVLFYKKPYLLISPSISNTELNLLNPSKLNI